MAAPSMQGLDAVVQHRWYTEKSGLLRDIVFTSKETILVTVYDRLGLTDDLSGYTNSYRVLNEDETPLIDWVAVDETTGMDISFILDTGGEGWSQSRYKLYVRIDTGTEAPILGPFWFDIV